MEEIFGGELKDRIHIHNAYYPANKNYDKITKLFINIVKSIKCLHDEGYGHYDIKPQNILMVNPRGCKGLNEMIRDTDIKLVDFGMSRNTPHTELMGTPEYISPEMYNMRTGAQNNYMSDIWALGCVLWELLTKEYLMDYLLPRKNLSIVTHMNNNKLLANKGLNNYLTTYKLTEKFEAFPPLFQRLWATPKR